MSILWNKCNECVTKNLNFHVFYFLYLQLYQKYPLKKMCMYRLAIVMYKLFNNILCEDKFIQMNFQLCGNEGSTKISFIKNQRYDVRKNIILNRFHELKNLIDKTWLDLSLDTYKITCKNLFLANWWKPHTNLILQCNLLTKIKMYFSKTTIND